ncbi:MAG: DUF11 domain-containing protein [Chloroflexi bacterium]|nr:DUF11 domain-containing protein [Chloroflexota bacterium]
MGTNLAAISGQFTRSLVLGTFFPSVIFVILTILFVVPLLPDDWPLLVPLSGLEASGRVIFWTFVTLVVTGLLVNANTPIIRFYEGYPWQGSPIGQRRIRCHQVRMRAVRSRWTGMLQLLTALQDGTATPVRTAQIAAIEDARSQAGRELANAFPWEEARVLPTRLGNVVRSFEDYPRREYGMDSVILWPRLVAVLDKEYAGRLDDMKSSFDFMLNSSVGSIVLTLALLVSGLWYLRPMTSIGAFVGWAAEVGAFAALGWWAYGAAISRAAAWGALVKGSFDLYRGDLLARLGYTVTPLTREAEQALWYEISQRMQYGRTSDGRPLDYAAPPAPVPLTGVRCDSAADSLQVTRSLGATYGNGAIDVLLGVTNTDRQAPATNVVVSDPLPIGFDYVPGSARMVGASGSARLPVTGQDPREIVVGTVGAGAHVAVQYRVKPRPASKR